MIYSKDSLVTERLLHLKKSLEDYTKDGTPAAGYNIMRGIRNLDVVRKGSTEKVYAPFYSKDWYPLLREAKEGKFEVDFSQISIHNETSQ